MLALQGPEPEILPPQPVAHAPVDREILDHGGEGDVTEQTLLQGLSASSTEVAAGTLGDRVVRDELQRSRGYEPKQCELPLGTRIRRLSAFMTRES